MDLPNVLQRAVAVIHIEQGTRSTPFALATLLDSRFAVAASVFLKAAPRLEDLRLIRGGERSTLTLDRQEPDFVTLHLSKPFNHSPSAPSDEALKLADEVRIDLLSRKTGDIRTETLRKEKYSPDFTIAGPLPEDVSLEEYAIEGSPVEAGGRLAGVVVQVLGRMVRIRVLEDLHKAFVERPDLADLRLLARISETARNFLTRAEQIRAQRNHDQVRTEHFLQALLESSDSPLSVLLRMNESVRPALAETLASLLGGIPPLPKEGLTLISKMPPLTDPMRKALYEADAARGYSTIWTAHVLRGALRHGDNPAVKLLVERKLGAGQVEIKPMPGEAEPVQQSPPVELPPPVLGHIESDGTRGPDHLDITGDVQALCSVLASREVEPPVSVGLFGSWGSGKSFFMEKMIEEIGRLRGRAADPAQPDAAATWCSHIVQIRFNTWHYIDSNLWASITTKLFEDLSCALEKDSQPQPERARELLLAATASARDVVAEAEKKKAHAAQVCRLHEEEAARIGREAVDVDQSLTPVELLKTAAKSVLDARPEVSKAVADAARDLGVDDVKAKSTQVQAEVLALQENLTRIQTLWKALWAPKNLRFRWLCIVGVIAVPSIVAGVLSMADGLNLKGILGALSSALIPVLAALGKANAIAGRVISEINKVLKASETEIQAREQTRTAELLRRKEQLDAAKTKADADADLARKELERVEKKLDDLKADRRLADYVFDRRKSTDYAQHLGVISRARLDFERLSGLLKEVRDQVARGEANRDLPRIDRIILYIDDLDRCPEDRVVQVLQAVHLLLAFDLFVVVVGVDPRWLIHSLQQHALALQEPEEDDDDEDDDDRWKTTPIDYLEKIFQIPYALKPLDHKAYKGLITGWEAAAKRKTDDAAAAKKTAEAAAKVKQEADAEPQRLKALSEADREAERKSREAAEALAKEEREKAEKEAIEARGKTPTVEVTPSVTVTGPPVPVPSPIEPHEWDCLRAVGSLIESPRAAKRLVNVYRLLRAGLDPVARSAFVGSKGVGGHRSALFLLALVTSHPEESAELLEQLEKAPTRDPWQKLLEEHCDRRSANEHLPTSKRESWRRLKARMAEIQAELRLSNDCKSLREHAEDLARYTFYPRSANGAAPVPPAAANRAAKA